MMDSTSQVRGRARGRARQLDYQILRPGNVQQSAGASSVRSVHEYSLQGEIERTTMAVSRLSLKDQKRDQVDAVPDEDKSGIYINLEANRLPANILSTLCQYQIEFDPDIDRTQVRKKLFSQVYKDKLSGFMFNGLVLITLTPVPPGLLTTLTNLEGYSRVFKIKLHRVDMEEHNYHMSHLVHKCLELLKLQIIGRHSCDALAGGKIPNYKIQLWPGYFTSIRQQQSQIQMCSEISPKCVGKDNVLVILYQCMRQDKVNYKRIFEKLLVGCTVVTDYNNRIYRIDHIDWLKKITSSYSTRNGTSITYKDYYIQRHQMNVLFNNQPLLVSRANARELRIGMEEELYLVPELCRLTGFTDNERSKTQMLTPDERTNCLKLYYQRMEKNTIARGSVCTRASASNAQLTVETVHPWVVMCPAYMEQVVTKYVYGLQKFAGILAMNLPLPTIQAIDDDKPATYIDGLEYVIDRFNPDLILCIINHNQLDRYNAIKKKCCVDRGVCSQIMRSDNVNNKGIMAVATQMYCKLGGVPCLANVPIATLMVIGIHVTRDAQNNNKAYSSMVSSLDEKVTRYYSKVSIHANAEELYGNLNSNVIDAVKKYLQENKERLPEHIIVYRDGTKDFHWTEARGIRAVLRMFYHGKGKAIKFAYIVVTKRATTFTPLEHLSNSYDFKVVNQVACHGTVTPVNCAVIYDSLGFSREQVQVITSKLSHMCYNWTGETRVPAPCQYAHKLAYLVAHSLHRGPNPKLSRTVFYL